MVIMDAYCNQQKLQAIWENIDKLHLSYLEMEDSPEKLEHRNKLEDCIRDFLCIASHNEKFSFMQTADVLYRSASCKKDFSGYKAATGWNALQLYAGNLLSQPWRKEYRTVKTYCGFYKHHIEANLVGAEIMFEAMGYKHFGDGILILEGPICPDTVTNVSKDCLIAYVECQILKLIWEEVSPNFNITWLNILEFRRNHVCCPEHSIRALNYQYKSMQQRQYLQDQSFPPQADVYNLNRCPPNNLSPIMHPNHSFPPLSTTHLPIENHPLYMYSTNNRCCINNYSPYAPQYYTPVSYPPPPPPSPPAALIKSQPAPLITNGFYNTNGYTPQNLYGYGVPTGQLIELDHHHPVHHQTTDNNTTNNYDVVDRGVLKVKQNDNKTKLNHKETDEKEESQLEDWDYVYRNLERQGYSKDLGERGDILKQSQRKSKNSNITEVFNNFTLDDRLTKQPSQKKKNTHLDEVGNNYTTNDDRPLKMSEALSRYEDVSKQNNRETKLDAKQHTSPSSSYENLSTDRKKKFKVIPPKDINKKPSDIKKSKNKKENEKWQCKNCTFLNENIKDICEICSKSKMIVIEPEMEIGGAECSRCTLVNPKDRKICQACEASLKDSPTYI